MKKVVSGINIQCVRGNIANQKGIEAIVNAANAWLRPGGGVAGAIHSAAGPGLVEECLPLAPIKPGQAVITSGHNLPNRFVIHCLGPVYGKDEPANILLSNCYRNALKLAEEYQIKSIAFSAISTGVFGYPIAEAAQVVTKTIREVIPQLKSVKEIIFVLRNDQKAKVFEDILMKMNME